MTCYIVLAEWMHEQYEEIAREVGWKTKKSCQVKFEDLPEKNREVMMRLAKRIIERYNI
jgi:metal-sulfur cluster biosynthetic enzyme